MLTTSQPQIEGMTAGPNVGGDPTVWFTEYAANQIGMIDTKTHAITEFAVPSAGAGPYGITEGPDGNIWFTESGMNQIGMIDPNTHVIQEFPTNIPGSDDAEGITKGPDDNLWFTMAGTDQIGVMNRSGVMLHAWGGTAGAAPSSIVVGPDQNLWFIEPNISRIGMITTAGVVTPFVSGVYGAPTGITGSNGNIWYVGPGTDEVAAIATNSSYAQHDYGYTTTDPNPPLGIAPDADGNIWFTQPGGFGQVGEFTPSNDLSTEMAALSHGAEPEGMTEDASGDLWYTEYGNGDGSAIDEILPGGSTKPYPLNADVGPTDIVYNPNDGNLYFTEAMGEIGRLTPSGAFHQFPITTPNCNPKAIAVDPNGNIWFVEDGPSKIGELPFGANSAVDFAIPNKGNASGIVAGSDGNIWFSEQIPFVANAIGVYNPSFETSSPHRMTFNRAVTWLAR